MSKCEICKKEKKTYTAVLSFDPYGSRCLELCEECMVKSALETEKLFKTMEKNNMAENKYCDSCKHADVCKNKDIVNYLEETYGHFLSFICKYRDSKPAIKEEPKKEVKPYKVKDIYEGMEVSKFGAE